MIAYASSSTPGPSALDLQQHVLADRRVGPLIINAATDKPYAEWVFTREWRKITEAAGIPDGVRNMDARAGAIPEGDEAGADLDSLKTVAAHATTSTTVRGVGSACRAPWQPCGSITGRAGTRPEQAWGTRRGTPAQR